MALSVCAERFGTWLTQWADRLMLNSCEVQRLGLFHLQPKMTSTGPKL